MVQLAILGHQTRGKEVIEILEMLGGNNLHDYSADCDSLCFYIEKGTNIIYYDWVNSCCEDEDTLVFTLEEFLEKFPYKVGDKVYNIIHNENQTITNMFWDVHENEIIYQTINNEYVYANYLQPYKEETMEELRIDFPEGYGYAGIENKQVIFTKIKPQYPKTYSECAKLINCFGAAYIDGYKGELLDKFQELIICRDAYWKIAGEQMGLGKPWEPDWRNEEDKYCIVVDAGDIRDNYSFIHLQHKLAFPTEEMRDAFYENFKDWIEQCKELL